MNVNVSFSLAPSYHVSVRHVSFNSDHVADRQSEETQDEIKISTLNRK